MPYPCPTIKRLTIIAITPRVNVKSCTSLYIVGSCSYYGNLLPVQVYCDCAPISLTHLVYPRQEQESHHLSLAGGPNHFNPYYQHYGEYKINDKIILVSEPSDMGTSDWSSTDRLLTSQL